MREVQCSRLARRRQATTGFTDTVLSPSLEGRSGRLDRDPEVRYIGEVQAFSESRFFKDLDGAWFGQLRFLAPQSVRRA